MTRGDMVLVSTAGRRFGTRAWLRAKRRERWAARAATITPFALAAASGAIYAAAFPPVSCALVAWVALVPLLVACATLSPLRAALAGMCWTMVAAAGVAAFLPGMLARYFGLAIVPSWIAALAIAAGMHGLFAGAYAAWVAWLVGRRAAHPLLLASGWMVCEFARARCPSSGPWALTAYSQLDWTPLIQSADLAGPYAIGMLVAAVNACAAAALMPALRGRRPLLAASATVAALAAALLYGEWRLGQTFGDGPTIAVAVVQGGAPPADRAMRPERLARYVDLTRSGAAPETKLVVWPESAVEAYLEEPSTTRDVVLRVAADARADLVLGGPHFESSASGTRYHNSAYLVRDGRLGARYDKHRLVPFAEEGRYTPGLGAVVLPASHLSLGMVLCVESMFPDLVRRAVGEGAEALVNLSNDAWFGDAAPARHQLDMATLRAVESRRYLVRAAATGFSAIVDPYGRTLARSEFGTNQVLNATVRASHVETPYQRWGDAFAWTVTAIVAGATLRALLDRTVEQQQ